MTNEQIIALVKEYFIEEEVDEDGYCWIEYAGKLDVFLKFALAIHEEGYYRGYDKGYEDGKFENAEPCYLE